GPSGPTGGPDHPRRPRPASRPPPSAPSPAAWGTSWGIMVARLRGPSPCLIIPLSVPSRSLTRDSLHGPFPLPRPRPALRGGPRAGARRPVRQPLYVYSRKTLLHHLGQLQQAFADVAPLLCYSIKTNPNLHLARLMAEHGAGFDVTSGGELFRALKAG